MSLVFAGVCSHAPGITGRAEIAPPELRDGFHQAYHAMREALWATRPDALIVIAAEHFANFFMNNMPAYAIGMGESYSGPIEDPGWLKIPKREVRGDADLSRRLVTKIMETVDVAYCEEWQFDHGIMVPLHFLDPDNALSIIPANINCQGPPLTPLHRAWTFGEAIRRAADAVPERIAVVGTGGISHWPATPDSGRINENWDRDFLDKWQRGDRDALLAYTTDDIYAEAGQGGYEIRTFIAAAAAAGGAGTVHYYAPIPIFGRRLHGRYDGDRVMAHAVVEWTDNLEGEVAIRDLLQLIAAAMRDADGVFPWAGIRVRGIKLSDYVIADDSGQDAFINITVKMGSGRSAEFKQRFFSGLFDSLKAALAPVFDRRFLALSLYVDEADEAGSFKHNNIHQRFRKDN